MPNELHFYIDDSGSKDPDRNPKDTSFPDWFALGGVIVHADEKDQVDAAILAFRASWPQIGNRPLRSYDIRNQSNGFNWLKTLPDAERDRFYEDLTALILELPITLLACVVDRPGYNARYFKVYGPRRWTLCRTAFSIVLERAAKLAIHRGARMRVYLERTDPPTEGRFKQYYEELRKSAAPFDASRSAKYVPLDADSMHKTLFEFRIKTKESLLMQLADLVLWPMCKGGYDQSFRVYQQLAEAGKLMDVHCTVENGLQGIKYSCFPTAETQKPA
nr:DUF3800 domain-containing protein [uncultured Rhodoferax sp.]